jgi:hypothetical protein
MEGVRQYLENAVYTGGWMVIDRPPEILRIKIS